MQPQRQNPQNISFLGTAAMTGGLVWLGDYLGAPIINGEIQPLPAAVWLAAGLGGLTLTIQSLELLARASNWKRMHTATGKGGTGGWAKKKHFKRELSRKKQGPFWGISADKSRTPLFIPYDSNAVTFGPAGSGKGETSVVPNCLSILDSKVIPDFKDAELSCMLKGELERRGERVIILNAPRKHTEIIGEGETYNPIDIVTDDLNRPGGLRDVMDDLREMTMQLRPEPASGESENTYFRNGARGRIADSILFESMIDEYDATLSSVSLLIEDRDRLDNTARWVAGIDLKGKPHPGGPMPIERTDWAKMHPPQDVAEFTQLVRARARNLVSLMDRPDNRTFESFITDAQQALAPFAFGRFAPAMGRSTFRMEDLKNGDKATSLFIIADESRPETSNAYIGLNQWCCMTALKRHTNKHKDVYFICDEANNYKVNGLIELLTWGRAYKLHVHIFCQNIAAFRKIYGQDGADTLISETEIKQFLPGQRLPEMLELMSKQLLGEQSVMAPNMGQGGQQTVFQDTLSESSRALMTLDELRRSDLGLLFVRRCRPIAFEPVSYAEVKPWRDGQVGINPFYGKPYRKPVKLRL
ncbi:MAG: type IV secretory system conjugative DNA transfer family protein [Pseudomonadota bacterium]